MTLSLFLVPSDEFLEDNLDSVKVTLSQDELEEINVIAPKGIAAGTRYPEIGMQMVNR